MAKAQNIEVTFDRQARDSIRSLVNAIDRLSAALVNAIDRLSAAVVNAIDRLSAAVVNGEDVGTLASEVEHVETLRRLVEDVKKRPQVDQVFTKRTAG